MRCISSAAGVNFQVTDLFATGDPEMEPTWLN